MTKETVGYVRLEWTCPNCGAKNPGPQKLCTGCGASQPEGVGFEQAAQEKLITDEKEIGRAKAGPDIHCAYCGTRNPAGTEICTQCGADLSAGSARASGQVLGAHRAAPVKDIPCPSCGALNPASAHSCSQCGASMAQPKSESRRPAVPAKRREGGQLRYVVGAVAVLLLVVGGIICALSNRTNDVIGRVETVSWTRSVAIEELGPVTHEDWRDEIPSGAVVGTCTRKIHHAQDDPTPNAEKVCGTPYTVDKGSGYGEVVQDCEYQVYADWCKYTVDEWQQVDVATLSGNDLKALWPNLQLGTDQREGEQAESYKIVFNSDGKTYTYQTDDADEFARCQIGSRWVLKVNTFNAVTSIEPAR
jgi:ribosomal protein L40E